MSQDLSASGDQQLLDQVIAEFLRTESIGDAGDRQKWLDRFPSCADELLEFFEDRERIGRLMMPVCLDRRAVPPDEMPTGMFTPAGPSADNETGDFRPEPPQLTTTKYRPLRFHARGGMGEIWLALDERIGRRVAIKKLRSGRGAQEARFLVEAQITGQLEHPSVVPLHDLGTDDAGQPFYVMKFIQGRKLKDAIAEYHAQKTSADWPNELKFRRLLETLVSICNVVAYAHHKGVLHRDIKPDNVMLGSYGETLVVDWGLAKLIGQPDEERGSGVRLSGSGSTATQDGAVVGSPYYMSPEGAEGRPNAVDQSSDVYMLGATLYEILTARPPRQGSSSWELIDLALHSQPTDPRELDPHIPRSLEAVCLKAMAFRKEDRYATPLALADDVQRFLAGEPTAAYEEPLLTRAARWMRCHRRGVLRGAATLGVFLLSAVAWRNYQQAQILATRDTARESLVEFHRLADEAQFFAANTDAISERVPYYDPRRAMAVGEAALAIAAPWGQQAQSLPLPAERAGLRQARYALLLRLAQTNLATEPDDAGVRTSLAMLDEARANQPASRGYFRLRSRSLALLGEDQAAKRADERAVDPNTPVIAEDHFLRGEELRLQDAGSSGRMLGSVDAEAPRDHLDNAIGEYRQALQLDPRHYWARFQLGRCLLALGRDPESVEALSACIAIRPDSPWAYTTRGLASALSGRSDEALRDLDSAVKLDPDFQPARLNRGIVYWLRDDTNAAVADFSSALAGPEDKQLIEAAFYRGQLYFSRQQVDKALADLSAVIQARPDFRPAYWLRAKTLFRLGENEKGLSDLRKFTSLDHLQSNTDMQAEKLLVLGKTYRKMAQQLDGEPRKRLLLAAADQLQSAIAARPPTAEMFQHLGAVQELLGSDNEAIVSYSQGLNLSADDTSLRNMRAWVYADQKQYDLARADFAAALRSSPENPEAHAGLGFVLAQLGHEEDARKEASTALLLGAENHLALHNVACIYGRLSVSDPSRKIELENLALAALGHALQISRQKPIGPDTDEQALIRKEESFPPSLRSRPEFQHWLDGETSTHP